MRPSTASLPTCSRPPSGPVSRSLNRAAGPCGLRHLALPLRAARAPLPHRRRQPPALCTRRPGGRPPRLLGPGRRAVAKAALAGAAGALAAPPLHRPDAVRTCSRSFRGRARDLPGWDARRGAQQIVHLFASAATPQTARQGTCPKGWGAIGRLSVPAACMGMSPCGASGPPTHPNCTPNAISKKTLNRFFEPVHGDLTPDRGNMAPWPAGALHTALLRITTSPCWRIGSL